LPARQGGVLVSLLADEPVLVAQLYLKPRLDLLKVAFPGHDRVGVTLALG